MKAEVSIRRYRQLLELFETSKSMMGESLRRRFPADSEARLEERLSLWVAKRDALADTSRARVPFEP